MEPCQQEKMCIWGQDYGRCDPATCTIIVADRRRAAGLTSQSPSGRGQTLRSGLLSAHKDSDTRKIPLCSLPGSNALLTEVEDVSRKHVDPKNQERGTIVDRNALSPCSAQYHLVSAKAPCSSYNQPSRASKLSAGRGNDRARCIMEVVRRGA